MKSTLFAFLLLTFSLNTLAARNPTIDDLQSIKLRSDETVLHADVHYPNYRLGGGNGPSRTIHDCFILDLRDSDNTITPALKMDIAQEIKVLEGFFIDLDQKQELVPQFKGSNVVFYTSGGNFYVTTFSVTSRDGRTLKEVMADMTPATRPGNVPFDVNLLYVRDCRL